MFTFFETLLNMSLTASVVILAVLLVRLFMKKAPRKFCYLLWLVVAFRLVVPFSFETSLSIFNVGGEMPTVEIPQTGTVETIPEDLPEEEPSVPETVLPEEPQVSAPAVTPPAGTTSLPDWVNPETSAPEVEEPVIPGGSSGNVGVTNPVFPETSVPEANPPVTNPPQEDVVAPEVSVPEAEASSPVEAPIVPPVESPVVTPEAEPLNLALVISAIVWMTGVAVMLCYGLLSYAKLKKRLATAVMLERGVYGSDRIDTPFALGIIKPRIYIPFGMSDTAKEYILAHEYYHLKRLDHVVKPIAFCILALHWFNPLCWLAFNRMSLDMELSCDEAVLSKYGSEDMKKCYTKTLLDFATNKKFPSPAPISFSEGASAKTRIKNALYWKKPRVWLSVIALLLTAIIIVSCAGNAITQTESSETSEPEEEKIITFGDTPYEFTFVSNGDGTCIITDVLTDYFHEGKYDLVIPETSPAGDKVVEVDLAGMNTLQEIILPRYMSADTHDKLVETIANSGVDGAARASKTFKAFYLYYAKEMTKGGIAYDPDTEYYKLESFIASEDMERLINILKNCTEYTEEQCYEDTLALIKEKKDMDWESEEAFEAFARETVGFFYRSTRDINKVVLPNTEIKVHQGFLGLSFVLADGTAVTPVYENPFTLEIVTAEEPENVLTLDEDGNEVIAFTSSRPVKDFHILTIDMADSITAEPHPKGDSTFHHKAFTESYKLLLGENIPTRGISFVGEDGKTHEYVICYVGSDGSYELVPLNVLEPIDSIDTPFSVEIVPIEAVGSEHIYTAMTPYSTYGNSVIYRVTANILIEDVFISRFERDGQDPQLGSIFAHYTPDQVSEDPDNPEIQLKPVAAKESFYVRAPRPDETQTWGLFFDIPALGENYMVCYAVFMNENGSHRIAEMEHLTDSDVPGAHYVVKQEKPQAPALDYASMKILRTVRGDLFVLEDPDAPESQRQVLVLKKNGRYTEIHRDYNLITGYYAMSEAEILAFNNFERETTASAHLYFTAFGDKKEIDLSALPEDETISYMKWLDPDHLLFVSQFDHGTIVEGGELWCYNTNNGSIQKLISIADPRLQITGLNVSSTTLTVKAVYFDETYNFTEPMNFELRIGTVNDRISKGEVFRLSPESGVSLYAATSEEIANNTFINVTPGASVTNKYVLANDGSYAYAFFCSYKAVGESNNGWMYEYTDTSSRIYLNGYANVYVEASASTSITNTWGYCIGDRYYALMDDYRDGTQKFVEITDQVTGPGLPEDLSTLFGENARYYNDYARADYAKMSVLYIYAWDQYFVIRHSDYAPMYFPVTLTIMGDTALGFSAVDGGEHPNLGHPTMDMGVYRLEKGKSTVSFQKIECYLLVEPTWFYSAVTDKVGYLSVFDIDEYSTEREHYLAYLYKTTDGGLTWEEVEVTNPPSTGRGFEDPLMAKFLTEDFGVISFVRDWDCDLAEYTQYTNDGGKTWHNFDGLSRLSEWSTADMSVCDITLSEGVYTVTMVISIESATTYEKFTSTDLKKWTHIPKIVVAVATEEQIADIENCTHFYDTEAYEKYGMYNAYILVKVPAPIEGFRFEALTEKGAGYSRETLYETNLTPDQPVIIHTYINDAVINRGYSFLHETGVRAYGKFGSDMAE